MKSAAMSSIQNRVDGKAPFLRVEKSARDQEAHSEENEALHQRLFSNEKTEHWSEDAVSGKKDLSLFIIERLETEFHASLL